MKIQHSPYALGCVFARYDNHGSYPGSGGVGSKMHRRNVNGFHQSADLLARAIPSFVTILPSREPWPAFLVFPLLPIF